MSFLTALPSIIFLFTSLSFSTTTRSMKKTLQKILEITCILESLNQILVFSFYLYWTGNKFKQEILFKNVFILSFRAPWTVIDVAEGVSHVNVNLFILISSWRNRPSKSVLMNYPSVTWIRCWKLSSYRKWSPRHTHMDKNPTPSERLTHSHRCPFMAKQTAVEIGAINHSYVSQRESKTNWLCSSVSIMRKLFFAVFQMLSCAPFPPFPKFLIESWLHCTLGKIISGEDQKWNGPTLTGSMAVTLFSFTILKTKFLRIKFSWPWWSWEFQNEASFSVSVIALEMWQEHEQFLWSP